MFHGIDLFSDTLTKPSLEMKKAMMAADLGDEQKGEDPTTKKLEEMVAEILGQESALFFPSSTMANEIAIRLLCDPGDELIAADTCHLFTAESGGPAVHAGVMTRSIHTQNGIFTGDDIRKIYRPAKIPHHPIAKLVSVENTTNIPGGFAWDLASLQSVLQTAKELNLNTHLDGSRLFNAVVKTSLSAKTIASEFDAVTVCLSKGLGCPIGAVLAFPQKYFVKVRRLKQLFGGAMRQSGILAAAGIYALQNNIERLADDHVNATKLAAMLADIPGVFVENNPPSTNMVYFQWLGKQFSPTQFLERCIQNGVRFSQMAENRFRAVTHLDIQSSDIEKAVKIVREVVSS